MSEISPDLLAHLRAETERIQTDPAAAKFLDLQWRERWMEPLEEGYRLPKLGGLDAEDN